MPWTLMLFECDPIVGSNGIAMKRTGIRTARRCQWIGEGMRNRIRRTFKKKGLAPPKLGYTFREERQDETECKS